MFTVEEARQGVHAAGRAGRPWLAEFAQAPATLVFDDFVRVYFSCRPPPDAKRAVRQLLRLRRPGPAGPVPRRARRRAPDPRVWAASGRSTSSAPTRSPSSATATRCGPTTAAGRAASPCRSTWRSAGEQPRRRRDLHQAGTGPVLSRIPRRAVRRSAARRSAASSGRWYLWYIAGRKWKLVDGRAEPVYKIRMALGATALTGRRGPRPDREPARGRRGAGQPGRVLRRRQLPHVLLLPVQQRLPEQGRRGYRIGYASSYGPADWARDDSKAGIDVRTRAGTPR